MPTIVRATLQTSGMPFALYVNDIRAVFSSRPRAAAVTAPVNDSMLRGLNEVRLQPLEVLPSELPALGTPFWARVVVKSDAPEDKPSVPLVDFAVEGRVGEPVLRVATFAWTETLPLWAWRAATPYREVDENGAWLKAKELTELLATRNLSGFLDEYSLRFEETDLATHEAPGTARAYYERTLTPEITALDMQVILAERSNVRFRSNAGGRLLLLETLEARPCLRIVRKIAEKPRTTYLPFMLGLSEGAWKVLR